MGTQSISPLFWAIQYGALNSARAMMLGCNGWWWKQTQTHQIKWLFCLGSPFERLESFFGDVGEFLDFWKSDFFLNLNIE